jgi:hypothetical protein
MLRHPGHSQLVRQHDNTEEHQRTGQDEGGHSQTRPRRLGHTAGRRWLDLDRGRHGVLLCFSAGAQRR